MKRITIALLAVTAVAAGAVPATAKHQEGSDPTARARFQGQIEVHGDHATLTVRYTCTTGQGLWISAKQVASRKKDDRLAMEGSSQIAAAWWQSHRNPITCDGKSHTQTFTMDAVEPGSKGVLQKGHAWVQFCIVKESEGPEGLVLSANEFVHVK